MIFRRRRLACSFCRRSAAEVAKLVAGPRVYICDRCAGQAIQIMEQSPRDEPRSPQVQPGVFRRILSRLGIELRPGRFSDPEFHALVR